MGRQKGSSVKKSSNVRAKRADADALMSVAFPESMAIDMYAGRFGSSPQKDQSKTNKSFIKCRGYYEDIAYLSTLINLRNSFINYGFTIEPSENNLEFYDYIDELIPVGNGIMLPRKDVIANLVKDTVLEYSINSNAVIYWSTSSNPIFLPLDRCDLIEAMGKQKLRYDPGYTHEEIMLLPEEERDRFKKPIIVGEQEGEKYIVIKDSRKSGFAWPSLMSLEKVCNQILAMESGEDALGYACRSVFRQHKVGHAIDSGPLAGLNKHFCKAARATAIQNDAKSVGFRDIVGNFDHEIGFVWPDPKLFDASKWESPFRRLELWTGPLGIMLTLKGVNAFLLTLLKSQCADFRNTLAPYLNYVINNAFGFQQPVQVRWSNRIFNDTKLAADMIKFLVQQGPLSLRTALEESGYNLDVEVGNKQEENQMDEKDLKPLFDAAHGDQPMDGDKGGRPSGTVDPNNQV